MNRSTASFISVQEFGITGPPADASLFTTFIVTIDLSSFNLELQGGQQYVVGVTNPSGNFITGGGAIFRQMHSLATGFEDLFQADDTPVAQLPGFLDSQHLFGVDQLAGAVSIDVPVLGDMNGDDNVTLLDAPLLIQALTDRAAYDDQNFTTAAGLLVNADFNGDVNEDGTFDTGDLAGFNALLAPATANAVPEPSAILLTLLAVTGLVIRRWRITE